MKTAKLYAFLILISAMQLSAMLEVAKETVLIKEEHSPFNYFDHEHCIVDGGMFLFFQVFARHLPTMRIYSAYLNQKGVTGYYREKGASWNERVALDDSQAEAIFSTLLKATDKESSASQKKQLLDQLHATITAPGKSQLVELHVSKEKGN